MVLGKHPVPGRPTFWIRVGQGPTVLAVVAGGGCLDIFLSSIVSLFFLPLSLGDGPIKTEILSQRAVKPKTTIKFLIIRSSEVALHASRHSKIIIFTTRIVHDFITKRKKKEKLKVNDSFFLFLHEHYMDREDFVHQ